MLVALDKIALRDGISLNIDRHIIAFVAAKIDMMHDNEIKVMENFPNISVHPTMYGACILDMAQRYEYRINIQNLCNVIAEKFVELVKETLHNVKFKQTVVDNVLNSSKSGDIFGIRCI